MSLLVAVYGMAGRLAAPAMRAMLRRRIAKGKEIPARLNERFGIAVQPRPPGRLIWFHCASVGETFSVLPVIAELAGRCEILLTTGTVTSANLAAGRLPAVARHQFIPLDVPGWTARFLDHWRPDAAVFVESELWPVLLAGIDARGIPRLLINARLSARSTARWRRLRRFYGIMFTGFRYIHAQSAPDAMNFSRLGIAGPLEWGNLKFCGPLLPVDEPILAAMRRALPGPAWLAASTHEGEEVLIIASHRTLVRDVPDLVTVIVPRHPERGAAIAALAAGLPVGRLSQGDRFQPGGVYVADTLGELGLFYRLTAFAFVGNSLVGFGGHNVIEPARLGRAVITGPHNENFLEPVARLKTAGALVEVADAAGLTAAVRHFLKNPTAAAAAGEAAENAFADAADLPARLAALILEVAL